MPVKKPETEADRKLKVRQDGRIGKLKVGNGLVHEVGKDMVIDCMKRINMQVFKAYHFEELGYTLYYGYCDLFEPIPAMKHIPTYVLKISFDERGEVIIETFQQP